MNDEDTKINIYSIIILIIFLTLLSNCTTFRPEVESDLLEHQGRIADLEEYNQRLRDSIRRIETQIIDSERRVNAINSSARKISDSIDRVGYLFDSYEREVQRLLNIYAEFGSEIKTSSEHINTFVNNYNSNVDCENSEHSPEIPRS